MGGTFLKPIDGPHRQLEQVGARRAGQMWILETLSARSWRAKAQALRGGCDPSPWTLSPSFLDLDWVLLIHAGAAAQRAFLSAQAHARCAAALLLVSSKRIGWWADPEARRKSSPSDHSLAKPKGPYSGLRGGRSLGEHIKDDNLCDWAAAAADAVDSRLLSKRVTVPARSRSAYRRSILTVASSAALSSQTAILRLSKQVAAVQ
ncbi:uncharacterized protein PSFLO_07586 [Pseudozyma flocculosa]|uniref:Uncharacterized protein n=1 Tax=Pseudozyma flocculosa TaxID=84751 RepID=A0A5C3FCE1_9BASI|nr:uncharacterized protein PSFLO_07586 [Pseudozyma flocculosa]